MVAPLKGWRLELCGSALDTKNESHFARADYSNSNNPAVCMDGVVPIEFVILSEDRGRAAVCGGLYGLYSELKGGPEISVRGFCVMAKSTPADPCSSSRPSAL